MPNPINVETTFINIVRIIEVTDIDYIIHFINTYNGKIYVFKVYKELFDKAMEVRKVIDLDITITSDEEIKKNGKVKNKVAMVKGQELYS